MIQFTKEQVILLHQALIDEFGGASGIRDESLLESAIAQPFQTFEGIDLYPSLQTKAAQLAYSLIKNHPFIDGNKRIGMHVMLTFLAVNGIALTYTQKELYTLILNVASGSSNYEDICKFISAHENERI